MEFALSFPEARVLGCLLEKEMTTPDIYPLTLNSLVAACNQRNNRDPVVDFDDKLVLRALEGLREKQLALRLDIAGSRVPKYRHAVERIGAFSRSQAALLCVLLLRGPQTVGELRSRTERMHSFADLSATQTGLQELIDEFPEPLITPLPRQPGRKEIRYAHVLSGPIELSEEESTVRLEPAAVELAAERAVLDAMQDTIAELRQTTHDLRSDLDDLRERFKAFQKQFE